MINNFTKMSPIIRVGEIHLQIVEEQSNFTFARTHLPLPFLFPSHYSTPCDCVENTLQ